MFNIGFSELIILAVIGLLVIGPEQLPEMARKVAKLLNELKRAKDEIMSPVNDLKMEAHRAIDKMRRDVDNEINEQAKELLEVKNDEDTDENTKVE